MSFLFLADSIILPHRSYALAPWAGTEQPSVRQQWIKAYAGLEGRIVWADSDDAKAVLVRHNADAVLMPEGKIIVSEEVKNDDVRLIRAIVHEEIEAVMQIISRRDPGRYSDIREKILSNTAIRSTYQSLRPGLGELSNELLLNDIVATGCELVILTGNGIAGNGKLTREETAFRNAFEKVAARHRFNLFKIYSGTRKNANMRYG
jgi:hypothetical protein